MKPQTKFKIYLELYKEIEIYKNHQQTFSEIEKEKNKKYISIEDLNIYDTEILERLLHSIKDELNTRKPYEKEQIAFIHEKDCDFCKNTQKWVGKE